MYSSSRSRTTSTQPQNPPLPSEAPPPLPNEAPPGTITQQQDDGWEPLWDESAQAYYFYNRFTGQTQWENPRVPDPSQTTVSGAEPVTDISSTSVPPVPAKRPHGGYDPAIHGSYDPNASYAVEARLAEEAEAAAAAGISTNGTGGASGTAGLDYAATGHFNRFTGRWQAAEVRPENHSDEAKSKRQMNAFFDVDAAANNHNGRSLKAERSAKKISKSELKAFKEKRRERKEEKRRAWLRD